MHPMDLYRAIGQADEELLARSERHRHRGRKPRWIATVAAILVIAVMGGIFAKHALTSTAYAIYEAEYPEMAPYPNPESTNFEQQYNAWQTSIQAQQQPAGYADGLETFFARSIPQFLSGVEGENQVYAPLNVYLALGMLAELTAGNSRQQILQLLGADSIETLRQRASAVWNGQYRNDGATTSILASSLWLNENISYVPETLERLTNTYYASSYQGEMGSDAFNEALQNWLNQQTNGLLSDQVENIKLDHEMVLALATTIFYQAKWRPIFQEAQTTAQTFHALDQDITCDFMHCSTTGNYYWAEQFGAVGIPLENGGGTMWFLLPDEGVSVQQLLNSQDTMEFLQSNGGWDNRKQLNLNLAIPKFDVSSQLQLNEGLQALGVTDVFDGQQSDFSPMTQDIDGIFLSQAQHGVRVAIDEEGITAAAYTVMATAGSGPPPTDEMDFTLDRPFLFAITSDDGLPLFVGSVFQPMKS